ncbi:MAG: hydantoinase/oxoprolinase family protein [Xanthomonadales bacterium]|nr:hydantoinase/oxoprolinase family protein [Xanthomonadales bacterium]NIN59231.1 hydantoinase/oxoprolinase family protein [Xanthomonadales bacterium]NIN74582.1 hydantoinase/oxoprolinase family protein [Xanthomonadales bacterium]NIO12529.1 hydantoinase/oxoprolinase family protein [Xanthomonadales bacterium]NIP11624.1 hydantoinase/oxoprolinase family protein [Xanthomonadales bacterium]
MKRIGVDIGGTFTDLVYRDDEAGVRLLHKLPSTPRDPAQAGLEGALALCEQAGVRLADIDLFVHGTTVATNILLEHDGAVVGLITTRGFRDLLHIGRKHRPLNFSHAQDVPRQSAPLAARRHRHTVRERILAPDGRVETELNEADVRAAVQALRDSGEVEAVAVCCLFSFLNPAHEQRIGEIVAEEWPQAFLSLSHRVVPLYREYERFSTTALNAYVGPRTARYIERFAARLAEAGLEADLGMMTSAGGIISAAEARERPVSLLLSGPVGALVAGIEAGRLTGFENVITLDVGGTSADIGVAPAGQMRMKHLLDTRIAGYDAMVPMADIGTIGAGGGSIARVDAGGMFQVGPESAGADPGPACYGQGGAAATVTDAMVALGWYRPRALRASGLDIDRAQAVAAIERNVAGPLGLPLPEAAAGIYRIAVNNMVEAIRVNSVARGLDPRDFALVAYGGAGAAFAAAVARELSIATVIVPPAAGVGAASGLLTSDMAYHRQATLWQHLEGADDERTTAVLESLGEAVAACLKRDGFGAEDASVRYSADCRYRGQGYELRVPLPELPAGPAWRAEVAERFHQAHERAYQRRFEDRPVMIVNVNATGLGHVPPLQHEPLPAGAGDAPVEREPACFPAEGGTREFEVAFLQRIDLGAGSRVTGPAVIEQPDTTTVLPPGTQARVHEFGHLIITACEDSEHERAH